MTDPSAQPSGNGPRVLVTTASKHGSTHEIGAEVARCLPGTPAGRHLGLTAVAVPVESDPDPAGFDVVVLGSAVYVGRWMEPARLYASSHAAVLRTRPVWLLSSGPIGDPPFPPDEPHDAGPIASLVSARGHQVFPGRLDKTLLSFGERAMVTAMRAPLGDFRDWDLVRSWAEDVAAGLLSSPVPSRMPDVR